MMGILNIFKSEKSIKEFETADKATSAIGESNGVKLHLMGLYTVDI